MTITFNNWFTLFSGLETKILRHVYSELRAVLAARGEID